jgi:hypothetical protein
LRRLQALQLNGTGASLTCRFGQRSTGGAGWE